MCFQKGGVIAAEKDHNVYLASASDFMFLQDVNESERGSSFGKSFR